MRFTFCPLFSGSSGNALYMGAGDTRILIDAGLSGRTVSDALNSIGVLPETLSGILVTHEHSDHVKGVGILSRKYHLPIYANARTFSVPHDAADPVGYRVYFGACSAATATDMGYFSKTALDALSGVDILVLESNHDIDMLRENEHYTAALKSRILGRHGHLSNEACAEALWLLYRTGVRHAVLGHLSHENNTPELAMRTVCEAMQAHGLRVGLDISVDMAWRDHVGGIYELG